MEHRPDGRRRRPKILLVSVLPYMFSARLALGLQQVGFSVAVVCPSRHPVQHLRHPPQIYALGITGANSLGPFGANARVRAAIEQFLPEMIVPCDDYGAQILHRIARSGPTEIAHLIENSLGPIDSYPVLESRTAQVRLARRAKIRTPHLRIIENRRDLPKAFRDTGPAFMKRDDSWAGQGVRKVANHGALESAWRELSKQHSLIHSLKNMPTMGVRHALAGIRRKRPAIHLQAAVVGQPAQRTVLCRHGDVIDGFSLVAVQTSSKTGPASVVRAIDNAEMSAAVDVLAKELRVTGLAGFDFIIADNGEAYFLEINARATPAATLSVAHSPDLLALLFDSVTGSSGAPARPISGDTIALFPDEMLRDEASSYLASDHHDIPTDEPGLVEFGLRQVRHKLSQKS